MDRNQTEQLRRDRNEPIDGRSSDAILRDIERTRGAMDETLDELGDRLHPRQLLDDAIDLFRSDTPAGQSFRRGTRRWGRTAMDQLRDNPVPAMLIGAGIAWLAFGSRSRGARESDYDYESADYEYDRFSDLAISDEDYAEPSSGYTVEYSMETMVGSCPTGIGEESSTGEMMTDELESGAGAVARPMGEEIESAITSRAEDRRPMGEDIEAAITSRTGRSHSEIGRDDEEAHGRLRRAAEAAKEKASRAGEKVRHAGESVKERTAGAARSVRGSAASARERAARGMGRAGERLHDMRAGATDLRLRARERRRDMSHRAAERIRENYAIGRDQFDEAIDQYPLAVGAGALAIGLIAGILLPRTRQENRIIGSKADAVKETAGEIMHRAKDAAISSAAAAANRMEEEGLTPDQLASKAQHVVQKTGEAMKDSLREEELTAGDLKEKLGRVGEEAVHAAKQETKKHREELMGGAVHATTPEGTDSWEETKEGEVCDPDRPNMP